MMRHYVQETDDEMRQASNRTYVRILNGLSSEVARVYGYSEVETTTNLREKIKTSLDAGDLDEARKLLDELSEASDGPGG